MRPGHLAKTRTRRLTVAAMLLAVGIILPFATAHGMGIPGTVLLPMHIPVFLCGFLCGPSYGATCGFILPVLNSVLTGMPAVYPMMPIMACELLTYGLASGLLAHKTPLGRRRIGIYASLVISMIAGRAAYGLVFWVLLLAGGELKALSVIGAVTTGMPGIVVQLLFIPALIFTLESFASKERADAKTKAMELVLSGRASCVVVRDGEIVFTSLERGIGPIVSAYEAGLLSGATVVDKVVGRAAAMIMALGEVSSCYGATVSRGALEYMGACRICCEYGTLAEKIINRAGDGPCPMEDAVRDVSSPEEALIAVKAKIRELRAKNNRH